jgi:diacylglycerol kinase (ATP)
MTEKVLVIINNAASKARRLWPGIKEQLIAAGIDFKAHETTHAGDATLTARKALSNGVKTVAVVGGDGTISEAAEGFFSIDRASSPAPINPDATLSILPAGTGNDFARGLLDRRAPIDEWAQRFIAYLQRPDDANVRSVDVGYGRNDQNPSGFIFVNVATLGIGPEVASGVAGQNGLLKKLSGEARFTAAACRALAAWRERSLRITMDSSQSVELTSNLIAVANSIYAGGGMKFAPGALIDDGLFDLLIASRLNRIGIIRELPRIRSGGHLSNPRVQVHQCADVRIEHLRSSDPLMIEADGNLRGTTPANFTTIAKALRVLV